MKKEMTESEIMKDLKEKLDLIDSMPEVNLDEEDGYSLYYVMSEILSIITRKNADLAEKDAEVERLKRLVLAFTNEVVRDSNGYYIKELSYDVITANAEKIRDELKAEAIKEVYTRLPMNFGTYTDDDSVKLVNLFRLFDQIAKEMGVELCK